MRSEGFRRKGGRLLIWVAGVLLLLLAGLGTALELTLPRLGGAIALKGPRAPVEVRRDAMGIATIRAASEADAAFALGFAHAQDRLFQMELTRRLGAGRLSEVLGPGAVPTDEFLRRLGLYRVAEANYEHLPADVQHLFQSYAQGVNAFLARNDRLLPPEFLLLGYRPEAWRPADSLVWGRLIAWELSMNWSDERLRRSLAERLSPQDLRLIWPLAQRLSGLPDLPFMPGPPASNNWAVAGALSATGKPLLANDPHLGLRLPAPWYLARLEIGGRVLAGATAPGVPMMIIGRNDHVAWGFTTAYADTQDLYLETLLEGGRYQTPDGPRPLIRRPETIRVRGKAPVSIVVLETRHGPLIEVDPSGRRGYALAWTGLRADDRTAVSLVKMSRAADAHAFREALREFDSPVQNAVFADDVGNIGYIMAGRIPVRARLDDQSEMPVPGDSAGYDWTGMIPFDQLPQAMDPREGFLATANNRTMAPDYPHFIAARFDFDYRIERIRQMIEAAPRHTQASMAAMQMDSLSLAARQLLPALLAIVPDPGLAGWDGRMDRGRPEPLLYETWLRELAHLLLDSRLGADFAEVWSWDTPLLLEALRHGPAAALCDDPKTPAVEDCAAQVRQAHDRAMAILTSAYGADRSKWRWGDAHRAHFPNSFLSRIPGIGSWFDLDLATDGDNFTLNRATPRIEDETAARFDDIHGASLRAIFDLAHPDRSLFEVAGGQSGNPISVHYADFTRLWRDGRYVTMGGAGSSRLRLAPESQP